MPTVLADDTNDLTPSMRELLTELYRELGAIEEHIAVLNQRISAMASQSDMARRLTTVPGIGELTASALVAAAGNARQFKTARHMVAWLGLTPAEYSTGGKTHLTGISKRWNNYVRRLLIHGARSCVMRLDRAKDRLGQWVSDLEHRVHHNREFLETRHDCRLSKQRRQSA